MKTLILSIMFGFVWFAAASVLVSNHSVYYKTDPVKEASFWEMPHTEQATNLLTL